jgi:putative nucleotidyltransferase with HDIG domain
MPVNPELQEKITQITNLPTLPQVATRLMNVVNDPLTSSSDVAFIVGQDLSLSAKVLRLANSAFYGMPRTITNINNAVVILGLRVINTMVLSLTVFDMFPGDNQRPLFDRRAFWKHSLACATIAKMLARKLERFMLLDPEEAFCSGLLHDIGKVVMEQYLHDDFREALALAGEKNVSLYEAEQQRLGYTHTDVADWLISGWQLPVELQAPLVYHHTPTTSEQCFDGICVCHYADHICYETGLTLNASPTAPPLSEQCVGRLNLSEQDIEFVKNTLPQELEKMMVFLDIASEK